MSRGCGSCAGSDAVKSAAQSVDAGAVEVLAVMLALDLERDGLGVIAESGRESDCLPGTLGESGAGFDFAAGCFDQRGGLTLRLSPSLPQSTRTLFVPLGCRVADHQGEAGVLEGPAHDGSLVEGEAVGATSGEGHLHFHL